MKIIPCTAIAVSMLLTLPACDRQAATNQTASEAPAGDAAALNGTYKVDLASLKFDQRPDEFLLQDGTFSCKTCIPPLTVAADGQFHAVADRPYFDSISVKVVDDRTVEQHRRKGDKEVSSVTMQVSEDGNVLTNKFVDATTPNAPPIEGTGRLKRVGPAPVGAHAISGKWLPERIQDYSQAALDLTYRVEGNKVTFSGQGQSYTAELGGPAVPMQGDIGGTTVAVARDGAGIKETLTRGGKEVGVNTIVPSADGNSVTFTSTDPRDGSKTTFTANRAG
jgi:hypothetical protein